MFLLLLHLFELLLVLVEGRLDRLRHADVPGLEQHLDIDAVGDVVRLGASLIRRARVAASAQDQLHRRRVASVGSPPQRCSHVAPKTVRVGPVAEQNLHAACGTTRSSLAEQRSAVGILRLDWEAVAEEGQDLVHLIIEGILQGLLALAFVSLPLELLLQLGLGVSLHAVPHALLEEKLLLVELELKLLVTCDFSAAGAATVQSILRTLICCRRLRLRLRRGIRLRIACHGGVATPSGDIVQRLQDLLSLFGRQVC
mmetsp:Transcript_88455/g.228089  ORF Transcript_88455/g.228089 Transcript_88455/m.228089 type:complete len:256 (+) Transcript_88455:923-1690(+)